MSKEKTDKRSTTSKANMRKAQQTKAQRQREEKKDIDDFVKKRRGAKKEQKQEAESPKLRPTKQKKQESESESDTSSSDEELVISSRRIKRDKKPKNDAYLDEIELLKEEIAQLKMKKKQTPRKRKIEEDPPAPIQQPIQQQPVAPIVHIHNPAPQIVEHKPNELVQKMKEGILRFE